jgi:type II secretory pathway component PulM
MKGKRVLFLTTAMSVISTVGLLAVVYRPLATALAEQTLTTNMEVTRLRASVARTSDLERRVADLEADIVPRGDESAFQLEGGSEEVSEWVARELRRNGLSMIALRPSGESPPAVEIVAEGPAGRVVELFSAWIGIETSWTVTNLTISRRGDPGFVQVNLRIVDSSPVGLE